MAAQPPADRRPRDRRPWQLTPVTAVRNEDRFDLIANGYVEPHKALTIAQEVQMDALTLLKADHERVKKLLQEVSSTTDRAIKTRQELFSKIHSELRVHETIEEEILYPALKEHRKTKELALEGYEEHHVVDTIMSEIAQVSVDDEAWMPKFTVMKENLEHHIEEEETEMFKQARQVFDPSELEELGTRMAARKAQLQDGASAA
jgi:hemerythrin superfamily protein